MNWVSSAGCIGSWCWSWPTSSLRKSSFPIAAPLVPPVPRALLVAATMSAVDWLTPVVWVLLISVPLREHVHQHAVGQLEGRVDSCVGVLAHGVAAIREAAVVTAVAVAQIG